jgi:hypothetical protein
LTKLQEKPSALKGEHPALQTMKLMFVGHFPLLDPDPDCGSGYGSKDFLVSYYPDPIRIHSTGKIFKNMSNFQKYVAGFSLTKETQ